VWSSHSPSEIYTRIAPTGFQPRFLGRPEACSLIGWAILSREFTSPRGREWPCLAYKSIGAARIVSQEPASILLAVTLKWRYGQEQMHLLQTLGHPIVDKPTPIKRLASQTPPPPRSQNDSQFLCAKYEHVGNILYFCGGGGSAELRDTSNLVKWWKLPVRTRI